MAEAGVYTFVIEPEHGGERLDLVLSSLCEDSSRSYLQKLIAAGGVLVNGRPELSKKVRMEAGDIIELHLPEPVALDVQPEDIPLDIVYEDDDLIVVNKPVGMVVHPAPGSSGGTLVNALLHHCGSLSGINGVERPGIVHRIDKDTSGLLVCAKSDAAHRGLSEQFAVHSITRRYLGICFSNLSADEGTIDAPVGRDPKNRLRMAVVPGGKRAVTHWRVLERFSGFTLFEARLETGRTHQIRVHMAHIRHPLLGDVLYGPAKQPYGLEGQLLHARTLGFVHPLSDRYLEFSADPPERFLRICEKLRAKA